MIDIYCCVRFGTKIPDTAWNIQENVKRHVEDLTDAKIARVNIHIMGVTAKPEEEGTEETR